MKTAPSAPAAPAWSPSKDIGVLVFRRNGQTPDQQLKDESECYAALNTTGTDNAPMSTSKVAIGSRTQTSAPLTVDLPLTEPPARKPEQ